MPFVGQRLSIAFLLTIRIFSALWLAYCSLSSIYYLLEVRVGLHKSSQNGKKKPELGTIMGQTYILKSLPASQIILSDMNTVSEEKKQVILNLYLSGIGEEFIAMQLGLEIPTVISILKSLMFKENRRQD